SRLFLGNVKIEIQMAVRSARQEDVPGRIDAHLLHYIPKRYKGPRPLGHGHRLSMPKDRYELDEQHMERILRMSEGLDDSLDARNITMMIGPPDIYECLEPSGQFVPMVGDVCR